MEQNQNLYQEYQQPLFPAPKKKINPAAVIIPIVVVVVIAAVVIVLLILAGKRSYKDAEKRYIADTFSALSQMAENVEDAQQGQHINAQFTAANQQVQEILGNSQIRFDYDCAVDGKNIYNIINLAVDDKKLSAELWSKEDGSITLLFPDISSVYLMITSGMNTQNAELYSKLIAAVAKAADDTCEEYFQMIGKVEVQKNKDLELNGVTYKADISEIKLSEVQTAKLGKAFIENLINNDEFMDALVKLYGMFSEEDLNREDVIKAMDVEWELESLDKIISGAEHGTSFEMTVYMKNNTVIGRDITAIDGKSGNETYTRIFDIPAENGRVIYYGEGKDKIIDEYFIVTDSADGVRHSGNAVYSHNEEEFTAEYSGIAVTDSLFEGTVSAKIKDYEVKAELSREGENKKLVISMPNICSADIVISPSDLQYKDLPQLSEGEYTNIEGLLESIVGESEDPAAVQFMNDLSVFISQLFEFPNTDYFDEFSQYGQDGFENDAA